MNELVMIAMAAVWVYMLARLAFEAFREHRRKGGKAAAVQGQTGGLGCQGPPSDLSRTYQKGRPPAKITCYPYDASEGGDVARYFRGECGAVLPKATLPRITD